MYIWVFECVGARASFCVFFASISFSLIVCLWIILACEPSFAEERVYPPLPAALAHRHAFETNFQFDIKYVKRFFNYGCSLWHTIIFLLSTLAAQLSDLRLCLDINDGIQNRGIVIVHFKLSTIHLHVHCYLGSLFLNSFVSSATLLHASRNDGQEKENERRSNKHFPPIVSIFLVVQLLYRHHLLLFLLSMPSCNLCKWRWQNQFKMPRTASIRVCDLKSCGCHLRKSETHISRLTFSCHLRLNSSIEHSARHLWSGVEELEGKHDLKCIAMLCWEQFDMHVYCL